MAFPVLPKGALPKGQRPEDSCGDVLPPATAGGSAQWARWGDVDRSICEDRAANARSEVALVVLDRRVTLSDAALAIESEQQHWERPDQGGAWRAVSGNLTRGRCLCRPPGRRELWSAMEGSEPMSDERSIPPEGQC